MRKLLFFPFFMLLIGCNNQKKTATTENISKFSAVIDSYTGGTRSVTTNIKVRFINAIENRSEDLNAAFDISPTVKGTFDWEDDRTLVFQPDTNLKQHQEYQVNLDLEAFINGIEPDRKSFSFNFKTIKQNFDVVIDGARFYDPNNNAVVKVSGHIQTADRADLEQLQNIISANQDGKKLKLSVAIAEAQNSYTFSIKNIKVKPNTSTVKLKIDGAAIGVNKKNTETVEIPGLDTFEVVSSKLILGNENYISVLFSNPLNEKQKLDGYVTLSGSRPRTVIDQNELRVYFTPNNTKDLALYISRFIQNTTGKNTARDYNTNFKVNLSKPELRLTDTTNKPIMPSSNEMFLPFQAVGLKAVDVTVVKIFTDNVLQHLQRNAIEGQQELRRVAQPIVKKTIDLEALGVTDFSIWNTFSLNLADIITIEPGAIYQINIGFNQSQVTYPCNQNSEPQNNKSQTPWNSEEDEALAWDNYESYYNPNYDWKQRDNPCSNSYYGSRRSIKKNFFSLRFGNTH